MPSRKGNLGPLTIRPVVCADAAEWLRLRTLLWPDGAEEHAQEIEAFFADKLEEPTAVFLAEDSDGRALGLLELSIRSELPNMTNERIAYVEGLYVEAAARGHNIARRLLEFSRAWAQKEGCTALASDRAERVIVHKRFGAASSPQ